MVTSQSGKKKFIFLALLNVGDVQELHGLNLAINLQILCMVCSPFFPHQIVKICQKKNSDWCVGGGGGGVCWFTLVPKNSAKA